MPSLTLNCPSCGHHLVAADLVGWLAVSETPTPEPGKSEPLLMSPDAAAAAIGLSRSTLYRLIRTGQIQVVRPGREVRVSRRALERYVSEHEGIG
jgi:excisionase family DNA binding protein